MLRLTAGMSRRLTHGRETTGFTLHVDGQIPVSLDHPEAVIEKVHEYFDIVREALQDQLDQYQESRRLASSPATPEEAKP